MGQSPFWECAQGPYGGTVTSLAVHPDGRIFASVRGAGIYRSDNEGVHWTWSTRGIPPYHTINAIVVDKVGRMYAGTSWGVYCSVDGGEFWTIDSGGIRGVNVRCLAFGDSGVLLAGVEKQGLRRRENQGGSWTNSGLAGRTVLTLLAESSHRLLAGTQDGTVLLSADNGRSWNPYVQGLPKTTSVYSLGSDREGRIFAGTYGDGIYISLPGGGPWVRSAPHVHVFAIARTQRGDMLAGTHSKGILRSRCTGTETASSPSQWEARIDPRMKSNAVLSLAVHPRGTVFAGLALGGILRSTDDGESWVPSNAGLMSPDVQAFVTDSAGSVYAADFGCGVLRSTDDGKTWTEINGDLSDRYVTSIAIDSRSRIYIGTAVEGVFCSSDAGKTWRLLSNTYGRFPVDALAVVPNGHVFAIGRKGTWIIRSGDEGNTWSRLTEDLGHASLECIAVDGAGVLFASNGQSILISEDDGESWKSTAEGLVSTQQYRKVQVTTIGFGPESEIYAGTADNGIFRSSNGGKNWSTCADVPDSFHGIVTNANGHIFAGGTPGLLNPERSSGVYRSTDGGRSWSRIAEGLPNTSVRAIGVTPKGYLLVSTPHGVHRTTSPTTDVR